MSDTFGSLQTPLGKVRGRGSAKDGTHHWWMQRVTGIALIPLTCFFLYNLGTLIHPQYYKVISFLADPPVTIALMLFIICAFYHAYLGIQVIIEDYVHSHTRKAFLLMLNGFTFFGLGLAALYACLLIGFNFADFFLLQNQ